MKQFRGGLVFIACRHLYHSTLGSRVIKKKKALKMKGLNPRKMRPMKRVPRGTPTSASAARDDFGAT